MVVVAVAIHASAKGSKREKHDKICYLKQGNAETRITFIIQNGGMENTAKTCYLERSFAFFTLFIGFSSFNFN
jgi:hypothetical protein